MRDPIEEDIVYRYACAMLGYDSAETHRPPKRRDLALARSCLRGELHRHRLSQKAQAKALPR